jgi:hypothetical protein
MSSKSTKTKKKRQNKKKVARPKSKKRGSKNATIVNKSSDRIYINLLSKIQRRKRKITFLTEEKRHGWKTRRSELYREITEINSVIIEYSRKKGYSLRRRERVKRRAEKKKGKTISYTDRVWDFESKLSGMLKQQAFNKIYIVNHGRVFYTKTTKPSTILYWYDQARNESYGKPNAQTPYVDVIEDYAESKLTIHIRS